MSETSAQNDALASTIAKAIQDGMNQTGRVAQVPITKYTTKTPWNPKALPRSKRAKMSRVYTQNGALIRQWHVTDEDIKLLEQLKGGRYLERKVEVHVNDEGEHTVDIRYNNKTVDQRLELKGIFRNFSELLRMIVAEQGEREPAAAKR